LSNFCSERVGDGIIVYDPETIRYHTLNAMAYDVWRFCDGQRTVHEIAGAVASLHPETHVEGVTLAVEELGEAGLLAVPGETFDARIQRRAVLKMAAAGVIGALGLPVVASITAPESASAQTTACDPPCQKGFQECCGGVCLLSSGTHCASDAQCCSGSCVGDPVKKCA